MKKMLLAASAAAVVGGLWLALASPELFLVLIALSVLLMIWLLPKIWRGLKAVYRRVRDWFVGESGRTGTVAPADDPRTDGDASFTLALGRGPEDRSAL